MITDYKNLKVGFLLLSTFILLSLAVNVFRESQDTVIYYPLDKADIQTALEASGLNGIISDIETDSYYEGHSLYVVRSQTEAYGIDTSVKYDSLDPTSMVLVASASSTIVDDGRALQTIFDQVNIPLDFSWEKWKRQFVFTTILYGGFKDTEEIYRAFYNQSVPNGNTPYIWEAEFPSAYCRVRFDIRRSNTKGEYDGVPSVCYSGSMSITIYPTKTYFIE